MYGYPNSTYKPASCPYTHLHYDTGNSNNETNYHNYQYNTTDAPYYQENYNNNYSYNTKNNYYLNYHKNYDDYTLDPEIFDQMNKLNLRDNNVYPNDYQKDNYPSMPENKYDYQCQNFDQNDNNAYYDDRNSFTKYNNSSSANMQYQNDKNLSENIQDTNYDTNYNDSLAYYYENQDMNYGNAQQEYFPTIENKEGGNEYYYDYQYQSDEKTCNYSNKDPNLESQDFCNMNANNDRLTESREQGNIGENTNRDKNGEFFNESLINPNEQNMVNSDYRNKPHDTLPQSYNYSNYTQNDYGPQKTNSEYCEGMTYIDKSKSNNEQNALLNDTSKNHQNQNIVQMNEDVKK